MEIFKFKQEEARELNDLIIDCNLEDFPYQNCNPKSITDKKFIFSTSIIFFDTKFIEESKKSLVTHLTIIRKESKSNNLYSIISFCFFFPLCVLD